MWCLITALEIQLVPRGRSVGEGVANLEEHSRRLPVDWQVSGIPGSEAGLLEREVSLHRGLRKHLLSEFPEPMTTAWYLKQEGILTVRVQRVQWKPDVGHPSWTVWMRGLRQWAHECYLE